MEPPQIRLLEEFLPAGVDPGGNPRRGASGDRGGAKDIGKVMAQVLPRFKGRADGKAINQIVREELQAG